MWEVREPIIEHVRFGGCSPVAFAFLKRLPYCSSLAVKWLNFLEIGLKTALTVRSARLEDKLKTYFLWASKRGKLNKKFAHVYIFIIASCSQFKLFSEELCWKLQMLNALPTRACKRQRLIQKVHENRIWKTTKVSPRSELDKIGKHRKKSMQTVSVNYK